MGTLRGYSVNTPPYYFKRLHANALLAQDPTKQRKSCVAPPCTVEKLETVTQHPETTVQLIHPEQGSFCSQYIYIYIHHTYWFLSYIYLSIYIYLYIYIRYTHTETRGHLRHGQALADRVTQRLPLKRWEHLQIIMADSFCDGNIATMRDTERYSTSILINQSINQ